MLDLPLRPGTEESGTEAVPDERRSTAPGRAPLPTLRGAQRRTRLGGRRVGLIVLVLLVVATAAVLVLRPAPPEAAFAPDPFDLGRERVGAVGQPLVLSVSNVGERPMPVSGVTLSGPAADEFEVVKEDCSARSLVPGQTCSVEVRLAPTEMGQRRATLELHAEMPRSPARIELTGVAIAPLLRVSRQELRFGPQNVATNSAPSDLTVTNEGTAPLSIRSVSLGGDGAGDFRLIDNRCSKATLEPGESCALRLIFSPRAAGGRTAEVSIGSDALGSDSTLSLSGEGIWQGAAFSVEPEALDFGRHLVGSEGLRKSIEVTNRQASDLREVTVELSDLTSAFALAADGCSGQTLAPGERCRVETRFAAPAEGDFGSMLKIRHRAEGTLGVQLSGRGVAPRWVLGTAALEFADTGVGEASDRRMVELRNEGSAAADITRVVITGDDSAAFESTADGCTGTSIGPRQACSVSVRFRPEREGAHRAVLELRSGSTSGPQRVTLTAAAVAPRLGLDREIVDFGEVPRTTRARVDLAVSNRGTAPLELRAISLSDGEDFQVLGGSCSPSAVLQPGASCALAVGFAPSVDGRLTARLQIDHDGISGPREVPLAGRGLPPPVPELVLATGELDFGPQPLGERSTIVTLTIRAAGTGHLELQDFSLAGPAAADFHIVPATCHALPSLVPGSDCAVGLRFIPSQGGERRAQLVIRHNAGSGVSRVQLRGQGLGGSPGEGR